MGYINETIDAGNKHGFFSLGSYSVVFSGLLMVAFDIEICFSILG